MAQKVGKIQEVFVQKLKEALPPTIGMAEELSELLGISIDSAYRRIRGETDLSISEIYTITKKYGISLDNIFSNLNDTVTFTYTKLTDSSENFEKYLTRIHAHIKAVSSFQEKKIFYVAEELPIFLSFFSKKLIEFKLFYWQRSVLNVQDFQGKKFEFDMMPERLITLASECLEEYKNVPSVEIWTSETINTVTKQIEFYVESGIFKSKQDAYDILDEIDKMAKYVEHCAETGRKVDSAKEENFQLYNSDIVLGTNCIYVKSGAVNYAYVSFNSLNSLTTNNHDFCDETEHWMRTLIKKSTLLSGTAEKQRFQFFSRMHKNIDNCRERIKSL
jgi:hypothetical protein